MSPPEMSRQLKRLIVKFEQKPPEGYANMNTAVGVSKKTFQWLEQLDVAADKLATFVQVFFKLLCTSAYCLCQGRVRHIDRLYRVFLLFHLLGYVKCHMNAFFCLECMK